jgi:hypothetical protein
VFENPNESSEAINLLDSLDAFLLAAIQEVEVLRNEDIAGDVLEEELIRVWRRTYAFASGRDEERLRRIWLDRGRVIKAQYPDAVQRRQIYKTSLSPRSAVALLNQMASINAKLLEGLEYGTMQLEQRFAFLREVLELLSVVPSFLLGTGIGSGTNRTDWESLLRWWVAFIEPLGESEVFSACCWTWAREMSR